ncbi:MAG: alpha/beta fold hydrolase [Alloprevotella sp.]|nr:alpha/beta fold hydrolase [Alloprevotella sp.]
MKRIYFFLAFLLTVASFAQQPHGAEIESEELWTSRDSLRIYGRLYRPAGSEGRLPLLVLAHGFGANHEVVQPYAEAMARQGFLCYIFDFCGGSRVSRSDGRTDQMSAFTERADLVSILAQLRERSDVDTTRVVLLGESQGGLVSAMTAAECAPLVSRLVLLYPAFNIPFDAVRRFPRPEDMPETYDIWGMHLGRVYGACFYGYDVWADIMRYTGPTLILHGNRDRVVPARYGLEAAARYRDAQFHTIAGSDHGFHGADFDAAMAYISAFLGQQ